MLQLEDSRAYQIFVSAIKTEATTVCYEYWLKRYLIHSGKDSYDNLIKDDPNTIQTNLENYLMYLNKKKTPLTTIQGIFSSLFLFFAMNRIILNEKIIKKMYPEQIKKTGGLAYTTQQIRQMLEAIPTKPTPKNHLKHLQLKALIHFFAASGVRAGAIQTLAFSDLTKIKNCYVVQVYAGSKSEYTTFLSPEASRILNEYLKAYLKTDSIDLSTLPKAPENRVRGLPYEMMVFPIDTDALRMRITRLAQKAGLFVPLDFNNNNENTRHDIPIIHGFRKRFNTILKSNGKLNPNLIELMLGHSLIQLDAHYLKPTTERLFEEYEKGIKDLNIYRQKIESENNF